MNHQDLLNPVMRVVVQGLRYMDREFGGVCGWLPRLLILLISYYSHFCHYRGDLHCASYVLAPKENSLETKIFSKA